jgi:tRNA(Ile)-lysidine synthase
VCAGEDFGRVSEGRVKVGGRRARESDFARRLWGEWRRRGWPSRGERVVVAASGGADSTALLLALEELSKSGRLGVEVTAAHLDHGLRGSAGAEDASWVEELARGLGFKCVVGRASVGRRAAEARDNLEQAARRARYEFLAEAASRASASAVLTGHTLDDQAETVLLRLLRGSGAEGLGGMRAERELEPGRGVSLRRPLLAWARREDTENYCRACGVEFRADAMNEDESFARVRVRRRLLPLLFEFNPRVVEALARTADLLREDDAALAAEAARLLSAATEEAADAGKRRATVVHAAGKNSAGGVTADSGGGVAADDDAASENRPAPAPLRVSVLVGAPAALRRRALRLWLAEGRGGLRRIESAHVLAVERLLEGERGGRVAELPGGGRVERRRGRLYFRREKD